MESPHPSHERLNASVYEQAFKPAELRMLIDGLRSLGENDLADAFAGGFDIPG